MLVQHRATLLGATCWPRFNTVLDDVDLSLSLLKMFFQHGWANSVVNDCRC